MGKKVGIFCGIAHPEYFRKTVEEMGAQVVSEYFFPDHDQLDLNELQRFSKESLALDADVLVCTEKDRVKISDPINLGLPIGWVKTKLQVTEGLGNWNSFIERAKISLQNASIKMKMKLWLKILIAIVLGVITGALLGPYAEYLKPIGQAFLSLISMIIVLLVLSSMTVGITSIHDPQKLGRVGIKTLLLYMVTTAIAIVIGIAFAKIFQPGEGLGLQGQPRSICRPRRVFPKSFCRLSLPIRLHRLCRATCYKLLFSRCFWASRSTSLGKGQALAACARIAGRRHVSAHLSRDGIFPDRRVCHHGLGGWNFWLERALSFT